MSTQRRLTDEQRAANKKESGARTYYKKRNRDASPAGGDGQVSMYVRIPTPANGLQPFTFETKTSELARGHWRQQAACKDVDPELFFPSAGEGYKVDEVKSICSCCPVRAECLQFAQDMVTEHGIWGGTSNVERIRARSRVRGT